MSVAKRRKPYEFPVQPRAAAGPRESLHQVKLECERLREQLQKSVIDNPQTAKKAALLISLWLEGKERKRRQNGRP